MVKKSQPKKAGRKPAPAERPAWRPPPVLGAFLAAVIFLAVAAFLLNVVVSRIVATQREQIAALKALGYENLAIGLHYLKFVLVIVAVGYAIGIAVGDRLGVMFTGLYAEFYHFPRFEHRIAP